MSLKYQCISRNETPRKKQTNEWMSKQESERSANQPNIQASYSLRTRTYFRLLLVSAENNVCKPEPGNDFCDVGILRQSQFSSSSPRNYCARYSLRGALEFHSIMESDWLRRNKSHYVTEIVFWLGFADVTFGGDKRQPEIRLRSQATWTTAAGF